jgi:hypothetical protein
MWEDNIVTDLRITVFEDVNWIYFVLHRSKCQSCDVGFQIKRKFLQLLTAAK